MDITVRYFGYNESGYHSCAVFSGTPMDGKGEYLEGTKKELTGKIKKAISNITNGREVKMVSSKHQEAIFRTI